MPHLVGRAFLIFAYGYLLSYGLRVINAIIGPDLTQQLALSHSDLGLISAAYLITFAALQLPLGIWLDRYGARRTEALLLLVAAAGCALFASSHGFWGLWLGRALIGIGVSACLMASLKAFRQWFAPTIQSRLGSGMFVSGTLGALCATVPVNAALPVLGWRGIFWAMALLLLLAAGAIWLGLQSIERTHLRQPAAPVNPGGGYRQIFQDSYFRRLCWIGAANQGSMMALQSLWLGPWMIEVVGLSNSQSAQVLFGFNLTLLLAYLLLSWRAPHHIVVDGAPVHGKQQMRLSHAIGWGLGSALLIEALCLLLDAPWVWILWLLFGLCHSATSLVQSHIGLTFPAHMAGRANTAYNLLLFLGAFAVQAGLGVLIDFFKQHGWLGPDAMRLAFGLGWLWQMVAFAAFMRNRAQVSHRD